jgi:hypothetical protein
LFFPLSFPFLRFFLCLFLTTLGTPCTGVASGLGSKDSLTHVRLRIPQFRKDILKSPLSCIYVLCYIYI